MFDKSVILKSLLILFLLFVIIVGVAYILFPSQFESKLANNSVNSHTYITPPHINITSDLQNQKDWKSYTNETYKYSYKYPSGLDMNRDGNFEDIIANQTDSVSGEITAIKAHITINDPDFDYSRMRLVDNNSTIKHIGNITIYKVKNRSINGYDAVEYKYETVVPELNTKKATSFGTLVNMKEYILNISSWDEDLSVYNAILSTLKKTK